MTGDFSENASFEKSKINFRTHEISEICCLFFSNALGHEDHIQIEKGGSICAHASIFIYFYMVTTFDVSTIKKHLFISIETLRSQESTLSYSNFSMTPV